MEIERVTITPASPEKILRWSSGEVEKPETLNYRTGKAEPSGLFSERIFGPTKDFQCACGETRRIGVMKGKRCDVCGVEIISSKVRRRRMGHITLPAPVAHIWFFRGTPSALSVILDIPSKEVERIIYYFRFIVTHLSPVLHTQYLLKASEKQAMEKIPGIPPEVYEDPEVKPLLLRLQQFTGDLVDAVFGEVTYILTQAREKAYMRVVQPLEYLSSFISKKELYATVVDEQTGEILARKGEKIGLNLLDKFLQAGVDCSQLLVVMDRKGNTPPAVLQKALSRLLSEEELEEDVKDPATGEQSVKQGTGMDVALWKVLARFGNSLPIVVANREQKKIYLRSHEKRVKQIRELVEGVEILSELRPYTYVRDSDEETAKFLVSGDQWKKLSSLAGVIRKRMQLEEPDELFRVLSGAEALLVLLRNMKLPEVIQQLRERLEAYSRQKQRLPRDARYNRIIRRVQLLERLNRPQEFKPEWLILSVIPVIPPDLRPMVQLEGGKHASSDLNELYRMVITRKNRLLKLMNSRAPEVLIRNEKRMLQEAVDALLDNTKKARPYVDSSNRPWKSIADTLKGKKGRFRQNLLGKRVDYSGRAVIVVGPQLKLWQCGLPRSIALELLKPVVIYHLARKDTGRKFGSNIREIRKKIERVASLPPEEAELIWDALEKAIKGRVVLLNRAPTLHRLGIQAFEPILTHSNTIQIHPLVCTAYNADFDGDQMAVHLPLSIKSNVESRFLMLSANNILHPADGTPIVNPTQDMVLGLYYITFDPQTPEPQKEEVEKLPVFSSLEEVEKLFLEKGLTVHDRIRLRVPSHWVKDKPIRDSKPYVLITTTVGKALFNSLLPEEMRYYTQTLNKKSIKELIARCFRTLGLEKTVELLDLLKEKGFRYATRSGLSLSIFDCFVPERKYSIVKEAEEQVEELEVKGKGFFPASITESQKFSFLEKRKIQIWEEAMKRITAEVEGWEDKTNPLLQIVQSGSRGSMDQVVQICGMRGLMRDPAGNIIPLPIRKNFREGLSVHEYFISTHGGRKGLTDTALRTSKSGYLTRRLVDLAQEMVVTEEDCGTSQGIRITDFVQGEKLIISLRERAVGRFAAEDVVDPKTGEILVQRDRMIEESEMDKMECAGIKQITVRSPITCESPIGVCRKCYGRNFCTGSEVDLGEAVGVIAAQAIGEPGTQLTLRTFHTGGIAAEQVSDITQGLPLAEIFFEVYLSHFVPRKEGALLSSWKGKVLEIIKEKDQDTRVKIETEEGKEETIFVPSHRTPIVQKGDEIVPGQPLTDGYQNPLDLLKIMGVHRAAQYVINMIQSVYRSQGVSLNDKHFEVILSQMLKFVEIVDRGDSNFQEHTLVSRMEFLKETEKLRREGKRLPAAAPALVGVKRAAILSPSFLSAASFQETARVLTAAALEGRRDYLHGLKENIIIGKEIPAGTGFPLFQTIRYKIHSESSAQATGEGQNSTQ